MFTNTLVDNRTPAQKRRDAERSQPRQLEMFSPRETAQFGAGVRSMSLPASAKLRLEIEDHRTPEEIEADMQREIEERTFAMFGVMVGKDGHDGAPHQPSRSFEGHADRRVTVNGKPLPMTERAERHSPDGYCWGYGGSGPSALAHAILAAVAGEEIADTWYEAFKHEVVAGWEIDQPWRMAETEVLDWLQEIGAFADQAGFDTSDDAPQPS